MFDWRLAGPLGAVVLGTLLFAATPEVRSAADSTSAPADIRIDNFAFTPPTLIIPTGTTVTWTNADGEAHTVVEKERKFRSAALDTDDRYSHTFTEPGEYEYICSIHPYMAGKILVKASSAGS
jgi:plastocyanin